MKILNKKFLSYCKLFQSVSDPLLPHINQRTVLTSMKNMVLIINARYLMTKFSPTNGNGISRAFQGSIQWGFSFLLITYKRKIPRTD